MILCSQSRLEDESRDTLHCSRSWFGKDGRKCQLIFRICQHKASPAKASSSSGRFSFVSWSLVHLQHHGTALVDWALLSRAVLRVCLALPIALPRALHLCAAPAMRLQAPPRLEQRPWFWLMPDSAGFPYVPQDNKAHWKSPPGGLQAVVASSAHGNFSPKDTYLPSLREHERRRLLCISLRELVHCAEDCIPINICQCLFEGS